MIKLTDAALHALFPRAPAAFMDAFNKQQSQLADVGVLDSVNRLAYLFANVAQESDEFSSRELVENIHYSPARACAVWPSRFGSVSDVYAKIKSWPGDPAFSTKLMDNVYGNRMGNRPGTHDGSTYIGRGALQLTGRDEYADIARLTGLDLVDHPNLAILPENQVPIICAYVKKRGLNGFADRGDFTGYVRRINGGIIGLADRRTYLSHMTPIVNALARGELGPDHTTRRLQACLNQLIGADLIVDGQWGPKTGEAVRAFQQKHPPLVVDGIIGNKTWAVIDNEMKALT